MLRASPSTWRFAPCSGLEGAEAAGFAVVGEALTVLVVDDIDPVASASAFVSDVEGEEAAAAFLNFGGGDAPTEEVDLGKVSFVVDTGDESGVEEVFDFAGEDCAVALVGGEGEGFLDPAESAGGIGGHGGKDPSVAFVEGEDASAAEKGRFFDGSKVEAGSGAEDALFEEHGAGFGVLGAGGEKGVEGRLWEVFVDGGAGKAGGKGFAVNLALTLFGEVGAGDGDELAGGGVDDEVAGGKTEEVAHDDIAIAEGEDDGAVLTRGFE